MNPDDLARILDELGQRLGPTGERVFALAVQYQVTSAVIWAIASGIALAAMVGLTVMAARFTIRRYRAAKAVENPGGYSYERVDLFDYVMPWLLIGALDMLVAFGAGWTLIASLVTLLNPEYAALRDILKAIVR